MTCRDAIPLFSEYLEEILTGDVLADLERHLCDCAPCVAYLNTLRRTRDLVGQASRVEMPEQMKAHLRRFLLEHLQRQAQ